ncbi:MAG: hypothetical protein EOO41_05615 [Methanobacteriota archaeon]|nr:MAG: hypothetical protein EOO41_05615 [Euryarchaeota archaeon]
MVDAASTLQSGMPSSPSRSSARGCMPAASSFSSVAAGAAGALSAAGLKVAAPALRRSSVAGAATVSDRARAGSPSERVPKLDVAGRQQLSLSALNETAPPRSLSASSRGSRLTLVERASSASRKAAQQANVSASGILSPTRAHSTVPVRQANHRRVYNALSSVLLAGPQSADKLRQIRAVMDAHAHRQVVLALLSTGSRSNGILSGVYTVVEDDMEARDAIAAHALHCPVAAVLAVRVFGSGPAVLTPTMVHTLFKFDTATREFKPVGSSSTFTVTTDAVGIDTVYASPTGGAVAAATSASVAPGSSKSR